MLAEPQVLQGFEEEGPGDRVESTRDVQLEKEHTADEECGAAWQSVGRA